MQLSDNRQRTKLYLDPEPILPMMHGGTAWVSSHGPLTEDTTPEAIIAAQRAEVAAAVAAMRTNRRIFTPADIAALSDLLILPLWNVKRHLEAIGITVDSAVDSTGRPILTDAEMMRRLRKAISGETLGTVTIAKAVGLPVKVVRKFMQANPDRFVSSMANGKSAVMWRIVEKSFVSGLGAGKRRRPVAAACV